MAQIIINFNEDLIMNDSVQIGDYAFRVSNINDAKGVNYTSQNPELIGVIKGVSTTRITVNNEDPTLQLLGLLDPTNPITPDEEDFIMFAKDSSINISGIKGNYIKVKIENNSKTHAELFTLGSEVSESSK